MSNQINHLYEFDEFRLDASIPALWRGDELVQLPPKALEALVLLVRNNGEIVSRTELLEEVWEGSFVEEGNINYTISLIRKALVSKDLIQTVPKRGYRFAGEIRCPAEASAEVSATLVEPLALPVETRIPPRRSFPLAKVAIAMLLLLVTVVAVVAFYRRGTAPRPVENESDAMMAYRRGRLILDRRSTDNREEKAIDEFQTAIQLDPTFALAYSGLAEVYTTAGVRTGGDKGRDFYARARSSADKALALDPQLAEAYSARAWIRRAAEFDWAGAESDLRRAISIRSERASDHQRLAYVLVSLGKLDEARESMDRAYKLDPTSEIIQTSRFPVMEARGEFDEALTLAEQFARENKKSAQAVRAYATFLFHKKRYPEVIEAARPFTDGDSKPFGWLSLLVTSYKETGDLANYETSLAALEKQAAGDSKALYSLAMNYAELGRTDDALDALRKCVDNGEERLAWLKNEPRFATLRADARFQELVLKLNLR